MPNGARCAQAMRERIGQRIVLAVSWALAACGGPDTCLDLEVGDRLRITILGRELTNSPVSPVECDQTLGLADGGTMAVTIRGTGGGEDTQDCVTAQADLGPTGDATWTFTSNVGLAADFGGRYRVETPGCTGEAEVAVLSPSIPSPPWDPTGPRATLRLQYGSLYGDPTCPQLCWPSFGIKLERRP